jgi:hypothetical protein
MKALGNMLSSTVSAMAAIVGFQPKKPSRRKPAPVFNSGPKAAAEYLLRRSIRPGKHSSLRKLMRAENIARGRRNEREGVVEKDKRRFRSGR